MSLLGVTKGTELEKDIDSFAQLEAQGVTMYYGLAQIADEKNLPELAEELRSIAIDEARHAGLYAVLNGKVPDDIFACLSQMAETETSGVEFINAFAQSVRDCGLADAATAIESAAADEGRHGTKLKELIEKYSAK